MESLPSPPIANYTPVPPLQILPRQNGGHCFMHFLSAQAEKTSSDYELGGKVVSVM